MQSIQAAFEGIGGRFLTPPAEISQRLRGIRAVVFDWDGVFNDGSKDAQGSSGFNEVDSMGTNLLRFGLWLEQGRLPAAGILTGVHNGRALELVQREHFHAAYVNAKHKTDALDHFLQQHQLQPQEVAFFFDDALDLSVAERVGLRICIRRSASILFTQYVEKQGLADYLTGSESGRFAVREGCELLLGLLGVYDRVMAERLRFRPVYELYYAQRQAVSPLYFNTHSLGFDPIFPF